MCINRNINGMLKIQKQKTPCYFNLEKELKYTEFSVVSYVVKICLSLSEKSFLQVVCPTLCEVLFCRKHF